MERAVIFCSGNRLRVSDFRRPDFTPVGATTAETANPANFGKACNLQHTLSRIEDNLIREALVRYKGNKKRAAEELGISRSYLYMKLGVS